MKKYSQRVTDIIRFIELLKVPSGKLAGQNFKLLDFQTEFINDVYGPVDKKGNGIVRRAILSMGRKNGKGLALNTPLPTPSGWTTMGKIEKGDTLFDESGKQCTVTFISENRFLDCYEIEFSNGEKIVCDGDHLWLTTARVNNPGSHNVYPRIKENLKKVRDTREIYKTQRYAKRNDTNHFINMPDPIICETKELPIHPYVLGAWLGDGTSISADITVGEDEAQEMLSLLNECGVKATLKTNGRPKASKILIQKNNNLCVRDHDVSFMTYKSDYKRNASYLHCSACDKETLIARKKNLPIPPHTNLTIQERLRNIGVLGNKHIPEIYLRADFNQRIALLQGLMDTDGTCDSRGRSQEFCTIKKDLLKGFCELIGSLGIKYSVREKKPRCNGKPVDGVAYYVQFCVNRDYLPVFKLKRKLERQKYNGDISPRSRSLQIVSVKKVESVYTKCIQVDSFNSMFLCGRTFIPTHNTMLASSLMLVHLVGPEQTLNSECYSLANDREQASIIFRYAAQLVRSEPELAAKVKIVDSTKTMVVFETGSIYRALSAEAGTKMGYNPNFWIYDELAQARNRELYDTMDTAGAARENPLSIIISTQSNDPQHILSQLIDDGISKKDPSTVCHLYEVPEEAEDIFDNPKTWGLSNPAIDKFRSLSEMATAAKRAHRMPSFESAFRNLYCNQRCQATSPFIPRGEWAACLGDAHIEIGSRIYLGLDLSGKTDLTALVAVSDDEKPSGKITETVEWVDPLTKEITHIDRFMKTVQDKIKAWFWKPGETLQEHEKRDRVPYSVWKKQGLIKTTPGRAIQYGFIAEELTQINKQYVIIGMAFDRYRIDDLMVAMSAIGLDCYVDGKDDKRDGAIRLVPWGQGYASMTQAVEAVEVSILERKFVHDGNPVLTWNFSNTMTITDPAGNRKLDKSKTRFRIDGAVACAMAVGLKSRDMAGSVIQEKSFWES